MDYDIRKILSQSDIDELEAAYQRANAGNPAMRGYALKPVHGERLRCWWGFHRWSKWWISRKGPIEDRGLRIGAYQDQERICLECLKTEMRHNTCL